MTKASRSTLIGMLVWVPALLLAAAAGCGGEDDEETPLGGAHKPPPSQTATDGGATKKDDPEEEEDEPEDGGTDELECLPGDTRTCKVNLAQHGGVVSCFVGVQTCVAGQWGPCQEGPAPEAADPEPPEDDGEVKLTSLGGGPVPCTDNPCNPSCQKYDEAPDGGVALDAGDPKFDWVGGASLDGMPKGLVDKGLREPCYEALDCQFDMRCDNPGKGACKHHECVEGEALSPSCNPCVEEVCAEDPSCCTTEYGGSCAHDPCSTGVALKSSCDSCVQKICMQDPDCCKKQWSSSCVAKVKTTCGKTCSPPGKWTSQCVDKVHAVCGSFCIDGGSCAHHACYAGGPLDPGCDPCVAAICAKDPWCCSPSGSWDGYCVSQVSAVCGETCPNSGQCVPWLPGETDAKCAGPDLTVGIPCSGTLQICNRGTMTAPAGLSVVHFPGNSQQFPKCNPNLSHPEAKTCTTTKPIPPGECINETGCPGLNGNREIMVNPAGPKHVDECFCQNNWSLYSDGIACEPPKCSGASSEATIRKVNLFIAIDKSGSMAWNGWSECMDSLRAFVKDPQSAGLGVALRFWPDDKPVKGCDGSSCSATACSQPLVALGTLTADPAPADAHEKALVSAIDSRSPGGGTPMYAALAGATQWATAYQKAHPEESTAVVLITDGEPTQCKTDLFEIANLAETAFDDHGVRTYVIGIELQALQPALDLIAASGGTERAYLVPKGNGGVANQQLLGALEEIRGTSAACSFELPNAGLFDPGNVDVVYTPQGGSPKALAQLWYGTDCGQGWYYDDYASPTKISLCPETCATVKADSGAKLAVEIGCPSSYVSESYSQVYEAVCPSGTTVQWGHLAFDSATPGDSSVVFEARVASNPAMTGASGLVSLATASQANGQLCGMGGPAPCPVDLYERLGGPPAANAAYLELKMTLLPSSNSILAPVVKTWDLTYSCVDSE